MAKALDELGQACDQVVNNPTMEHWYCGNPPKQMVNGKTLCTFHANRRVAV
tara:strand:+ start:86 stop:238 length:153 start_codon:yes stop_codon:yes gene_type:complete